MRAEEGRLSAIFLGMKVGQRQFTNIMQQSGESGRPAGRKPGLHGQFLRQQTTGDGVSPQDIHIEK